MQKIELLCFGNAIVDMFAKVDSVFLERFGIGEPAQHVESERLDAMLRELSIDTPLAADESAASKNTSTNAIFSSGGGAANVAKIAAMLGVNAAFSGCTGQDALADIFEKELTGAGAAALLKKGSARTGVCLILESRESGQKDSAAHERARPKTETRIAASPGAALEFNEDDVSEELIAQAEVVVLDGFILERTPLARKILYLADRRGIPVALDAASVWYIREKTEEILQYCRTYPLFVFMNADETIAFYNRITRNPDEENMSEREKETMILDEVCATLKIISDGEIFPVFVIKLGGRGAVVVAGGNVYREETFTIRPRNAIGAGDTFCAAFLAAWIRGKSLSECAALGNKAAREILDVPGTKIRPEKLAALAKQLR